MEKNEGIILFSLILAVVFGLLLTLNYNLTGKATGELTLTVEKNFTIASPLNTTYNFSSLPYTIDLNVSANNFNATNWSYTLWDLHDDQIINDTIYFTPNSTFDAVRWGNTLIVTATANDSETISQNVTFYIEIPNSAPVLSGINSSIYVCEDSALSYSFSVGDVDEDDLTLSMVPTNPFFITPVFVSGEGNKTIEIFSGLLDRSSASDGVNNWKVYSEVISVDDDYSSSCCVDSENTNITVIGVNDAPVMSNIGVQTVWTQGDNSSFYKQASVSDEEDGNQDYSGITFNISFQGGDLFNVTNNGVMNFTPSLSQVGNYNVTLCAIDSGISNFHTNISFCGQTGGSLNECETFGLTITNENRAPSIVEYSPSSLSFSTPGTSSISFSATEYDEDGTFPDAYWYVGDSLVEVDSGNLTDGFSYSFGCGVSGTSNISLVITDGELNDSISWSVSYSKVNCTASSSGSSGGGGGAVKTCIEKWGCGIWEVCQEIEEALISGVLTGEDYRFVKEDCSKNNYLFCGVQLKNCVDVNDCGTEYNKPIVFQSCYYTENPGCEDGIKNCHSGGCELLVDCGGPCKACPTCSDGIQNQGELGIDCGGPCPKCEIVEDISLAPERSNLILYGAIVLAMLVILILVKVWKIYANSKRIKE